MLDGIPVETDDVPLVVVVGAGWYMMLVPITCELIAEFVPVGRIVCGAVVAIEVSGVLTGVEVVEASEPETVVLAGAGANEIVPEVEITEVAELPVE